MFSPLLAALRTSWPDCWIDWIAETKFLDVLSANPYLDGYLGWRPNQVRTAYRMCKVPPWYFQYRRLASVAAGGNYDLLINFNGTETPWFSDLTGASRRMAYFDVFPGFNARGVDSPEREHYTDAFLDCETLIPRTSEYLLPLRALGLPDGPPVSQAGYTAEDQRSSEAILQRLKLRFDEPYIVVAPRTTRSTKNWSVERFAFAADRISRELNTAVVIVGAKADIPSTQTMDSGISALTLNCCGRLTFRQTLAVMSKARIVITGDTAAMHAAGALNVPAVAIFGSTSVQSLLPRSGRVSAIGTTLPCAPCNLTQCPRTGTGFEECLTRISVDEVVVTGLRIATGLAA